MTFRSRYDEIGKSQTKKFLGKNTLTECERIIIIRSVTPECIRMAAMNPTPKSEESKMSEMKAAVPISGRVSEEDYQFLMAYPISGKVTASEKLRYVVSFFRSYHESLSQYEESLTEMGRLLESARKDIKKAEADTASASELVDRLMQVIPELMATMITAKVPKKGDRQLPALIDFEERLIKTTMLLIESVLRMGLTTRSPTYNPSILSERMETIRELVALSRQG